MPPKSINFVYGSMVDNHIQNVDGISLRFAEKQIRGYTLFSWMSK